MEDSNFLRFYCPHSVDSVQLNIDCIEFREKSRILQSPFFLLNIQIIGYFSESVNF